MTWKSPIVLTGTPIGDGQYRYTFHLPRDIEVSCRVLVLNPAADAEGQPTEPKPQGGK